MSNDDNRFAAFNVFERDIIFYALQRYSPFLTEGNLASNTVRSLETEIVAANLITVAANLTTDEKESEQSIIPKVELVDGMYQFIYPPTGKPVRFYSESVALQAVEQYIRGTQ